MLTATAIALVGIDGGSYTITSRQYLALAVWIAVAAGALFGGLGVRAAGGPLALLTALVAWIGASVAWATSAERAVLEAHRGVLLLGVFVLPLVLLSRRDLRAASGGIASGIVFVAFVALASRLFPARFPEDAVEVAASAPRLSYPVNYWNALGVLVSLALPLLVAEAARPGAAWRRGLAVAPVPALMCVVYLSSSRTAAAAVAVSALALMVLAADRWSTTAAAVASAAGAAVSVALLTRFDSLVNHPGTEEAAQQGPVFATLLLALTTVLALSFAAAARSWKRPRWAGARLGWALAGAAALAVVAAIAMANPGERVAAFREPPETFSVPRDDYIRAHLVSGHGRGRWQIWNAAVDQFRAQPIQGGGAGSFEAWWAQHGTLSLFVRDAHSLYLETMAELGVVGLLLLLSFFVVVLTLGIRAGIRSLPAERTTAAGLLGVGGGFLAAAALDWMWEVTAISSTAFLAFGLALLLLTPEVEQAVGAGGFASRLMAAAVALSIAAATAVMLLGERELQRSRSAAAAGDTGAAVERAAASRALQPWAASPSLQLALVQERAGAIPAARRSIEDALRKDGADWRLWLVSARLAAREGDIEAAQASLSRAAELNPRSPLFAGFESPVPPAP